MNRLPTYWCVRNDGTALFKERVINYLFEIHGQRWSGDVPGAYYGYDGNPSNNGTDYFHDPHSFQNSAKVLTVTEFINLTSFVCGTQESSLPEKWCVAVNERTIGVIGKYFSKQARSKCYNSIEGTSWTHYKSHNDSNHSIMAGGGGLSYAVRSDSAAEVMETHTLISYEDFLRLVLCESPTTMPMSARPSYSVPVETACTSKTNCLTPVIISVPKL